MELPKEFPSTGYKNHFTLNLWVNFTFFSVPQIANEEQDHRSFLISDIQQVATPTKHEGHLNARIWLAELWLLQREHIRIGHPTEVAQTPCPAVRGSSVETECSQRKQNLPSSHLTMQNVCWVYIKWILQTEASNTKPRDHFNSSYKPINMWTLKLPLICLFFH